jgi:Uma2 family endonuclease
MSHALAEVPYDLRDIIENIVTEDDEPVDNLFSAKQQTLLKRPLYASWTPQPNEDQPHERRIFLADVNIGLFFSLYESPLVPDFFLSLDVEPHEDWYAKEHRSYFVWEFGKVPEIALEIVSNRKGGELASKFKAYARMGVSYYVIYDPQKRLSQTVLCVYELGFGKRYRPRKDYRLPELGLSLTLWHGVFEGREDTWARWCDAEGQLIPTGEERAILAEARVLSAEQRAAQAEAKLAKLRAELARQAGKPSRKRSK